jgi:site-specific recombinase XerD
MKPTDFAYHVSRYLSEYLPGVAGLGVNTIMSYRDMFKGLLKFYEEVIDVKPEKVTLDDFNMENVVRYGVWLEESRKNSISTRNNRLAAIHAFAKYIGRREPEKMHSMQEIIALPMKKGGVSTPTYLSVDALEYMLSLPDAGTRSGRRDLVLLCLLYDSGARVQELCDIKVEDVRLEDPCIVHLRGKGSKTRVVPLMPPMANLLRQYIDEWGLASPEQGKLPLFSNHSRAKLGRKGVSYILLKYFRKGKESKPSLFPDNISPHCLRHSKSMHLLQAGINLVYIRDILGHADIKTTEVYARIDNEMKRKALEKVSSGVVSGTMPVWQKDSKLLEWLNSLS